MKTDVLIIGGGLAGLSCANTLTQQGISNLILEADREIGGRARTDQFHGFLLDRGFQVFSTAYPEAKRALNYDALKLQKFYPGTIVRFGSSFHRVSDPFRNPLHALKSLINPIGTLQDKIRVAAWRRRVLTGTVEELFQKPETSTLKHLQAMGFSQEMIDRFFRPFLGGVFMDQELKTSSRIADFLFRMFASGDISLPAGGIGSIAQQLASNLQSDQIRTDNKVVKIDGTTVTIHSGETLQARQVVIATENSTAKELFPHIEVRPWHHTTCLYFSAPKLPITGPYLILNGGRTGIVNSCTVLSEVSPSYAPTGEHLVSVTTRGIGTQTNENIEDDVRREFIDWFGPEVMNWIHLRTYQILKGQPMQTPPFHPSYLSSSKLQEGLNICGDHHATATFDGALGSGRRAAEEVIKDLSA